MRSLTIGRVLGIPIRVNLSLLLFLPLLVWLIQDSAGEYLPFVNAISPVAVDPSAFPGGNAPLVVGVVAAFGLLLGVLLHELGHSVVAMRHGVSIASITLWIFGGLARMDDLPEDWRIEFRVALAGPVTSLLVALACFVGLHAMAAIGGTSPVPVFVVAWLVVINCTLAAFNMLPAFPMDGGRILRALLARRRHYVEATAIAARVGRYAALAMVVLGILSWAPLLALVGLFVYVAAGAESRVTAVRDLLRDVTVGDLVSGEPGTVDAAESVEGLVDRLLAERRTGYPVVDGGGRVVGLVSLPVLRSVPSGDRSATTVADVMLRDPPVLGPDTPAFGVLEALAQSAADRVVVVDGAGAVLGTLEADDVVSYIDLVQGLGPADGPEDVVPGEGYA